MDNIIHKKHTIDQHTDAFFFGSILSFFNHYPCIAQHYLLDIDDKKTAVVYVPHGVILLKPVILSNFFSSNILEIQKYIVIVESGASVAISDIGTTLANRDQLIDYSVIFFLKQNSYVTFMHDRLVSKIDALTCKVSVSLQEDSFFSGVFITTTGKKIDIAITIDCAGKNARAFVRGIYLLDNNQKNTVTVWQKHTASNTYSDVVVRGVVEGNASADYRGTVFIEKNAYKSDASQENKNILLGDSARATSIPNLEVLTHDVACSHASAVGHCNDEQLFYAQARGISVNNAKKLLLYGFLSDVFNNCDTNVQKYMSERIKKHLELIV